MSSAGLSGSQAGYFLKKNVKQSWFDAQQRTIKTLKTQRVIPLYDGKFKPPLALS